MLERRAARTIYVGFRATQKEARVIAQYAKRKCKTTTADFLRALVKREMSEMKETK